MTRNHSGGAFAVEASDQVGDGIAGATARGLSHLSHLSRLSRLSEGAPLGDGQQDFGAGDVGRGPGLSAGDLLQLRSLLFGERAERFLQQQVR